MNFADALRRPVPRAEITALGLDTTLIPPAVTPSSSSRRLPCHVS